MHLVELANRRATLALAIISAFGGAVIGASIQWLLPLDTSITGILYALSVLTATVGTYLALVLLLLAARIPVIERSFGHDRLITIHKKLGPWVVYLIAAHILLILQSNAQAAGYSAVDELVRLWNASGDMRLAILGTLIFLIAGLVSWKRIRNRISHETWWTIHLLFYLATVMAFFHQITEAGPFLEGWPRALWIGLYVITAAALLYYRLVLPQWRTFRYQLRVERVIRETPNVVSVVMKGRNLHRLRIRPGQFMNFRFNAPGQRLDAHPYSISGIALHANKLRITVKDLGDASAGLADLQPGTRVGFEGPYGAVTPERHQGSRVVLVAGGVGISPVRSLAEAFAGRTQVDVVYRASSERDLALGDELAAFTRKPGFRYHALAGPRKIHPLDAKQLHGLVGNLSTADVFICGPEALAESVAHAAVSLGASRERIYQEEYNL